MTYVSVRDTQEKRACVMWFSQGNLIWRINLKKGITRNEKANRGWRGDTRVSGSGKPLLRGI